jgi:hypothetical protein
MRMVCDVCNNIGMHACMHMHVCMYACMYAWMDGWNACMHECLYVCMMYMLKLRRRIDERGHDDTSQGVATKEDGALIQNWGKKKCRQCVGKGKSWVTLLDRSVGFPRTIYASSNKFCTYTHLIWYGLV